MQLGGLDVTDMMSLSTTHTFVTYLFVVIVCTDQWNHWGALGSSEQQQCALWYDWTGV